PIPPAAPVRRIVRDVTEPSVPHWHRDNQGLPVRAGDGLSGGGQSSVRRRRTTTNRSTSAKSVSTPQQTAKTVSVLSLGASSGVARAAQTAKPAVSRAKN